MSFEKSALLLLVYAPMLALLSACASTETSTTVENVTADGLVKVQESGETIVFAKPDINLSAYTKILIIECAIAMRDSWQSDESPQLSRASQISDSDLERFTSKLAELFRSEFTDKLSESKNLEVVSASGENTLIMRPAIFDLDIPAGELRNISRTIRMSPNSGTGTLFLELNDSVTGELLLRIVSQKKSKWTGAYLRTDTSSDFQIFRLMLRSWSASVSGRLDDIYAK